MPDLDALYEQLLHLPRSQYADLIKRVDAERRQAAVRDELEHRPNGAMSRDEFARWVAQRHYAIDKGISRILYLPAGAPPNEVRLLEVNELASIPEQAPVQAVDFMPDIEGLPFSLLVADVTPRQFEVIRGGQLALPAGWSLEGAEEQPPPDR